MELDRCPVCNGVLREHVLWRIPTLGKEDPADPPGTPILLSPYDRDSFCLGRAVGSKRDVLAEIERARAAAAAADQKIVKGRK